MYVCGNCLTECCNLFSQQVSLPIHSDATTTSKSTLTISGEYSYVCVKLALSVSYSNEYGDNSHPIFQDRRDDEPQITEEVFFYKMLPLDVEVLVPELKEHGILLDESIVSSVDMPMGGIDELHYVMYRLGKKENGLQIFYRCLRETQDECPDHRRVADMIEREGKDIKGRGMQSLVNPRRACNNFIMISTLSLVSTSSKYGFFGVSIHNTVCQVSITDLHSGSTHREFNNYECSSHHLRVFYHCLDHCGVWMIT